MKINRFSCKCKKCKAKWTTTERDRLKAFTTHAAKCVKSQAWIAKSIAAYPNTRNFASECAQLSCGYFEHIEIEGSYNAAVKCDGRCMGATGHVCDCSCGGANHGIGATA